MHKHDDPFLDAALSRVCEYCGIEFVATSTCLKFCGGRIRYVCWVCLGDIQKSEQGQDMTKV